MCTQHAAYRQAGHCFSAPKKYRSTEGCALWSMKLTYATIDSGRTLPVKTTGSGGSIAPPLRVPPPSAESRVLVGAEFLPRPGGTSPRSYDSCYHQCCVSPAFVYSPAIFDVVCNVGPTAELTVSCGFREAPRSCEITYQKRNCLNVQPMSPKLVSHPSQATFGKIHPCMHPFDACSR